MSKIHLQIDKQQLLPKVIIITAGVIVLINIIGVLRLVVSGNSDLEVAPDTEAVKIQKVNQAASTLKEKTLPIDNQF